MSKNDFEYDLFISYTHLDNRALSKEEEGWISRFHYSLTIRLGQLLGREPKIWRDSKLQGNDEFSDEIISELRKSKALLTVISPRYLESEWCLRELHRFLKAAETNIGVRIGNKSRVFKMVKTYVPFNQHPDEIRGLNGYKFCELDENDRPHEFSPEKGSRHYQKFWERLEDVAWDIHQLIKELDQPGKVTKEQPENPPEKTVYLAETTSDLREEWENIRRDLTLQGYTVLPDRPLPYLLKDGNFKDTVRDYLNHCKLSVHLIGNRYGLIPEEEERSIVELQNQLAAEQCENGQLTCLIRVPPGLEKKTESARQKEYITTLQDDAPRVKGTELLETGLEDFKTHIQDTLVKLNKAPEKEVKPEGAAEAEGPARVYLVCDRQDMETVEPLDDCLYNEGFEVLLPLFEGNETERREMHKEYLTLCDAMIIYYDHANELWLNTKLNDLRKAPGYGRTKPIQVSTVLVSGEKNRHKERFRSREAEVIKHFGSFSRDVLSSFISHLKGGRGNGGGQ
jgi:hypothetical protein